MTTEPAAGCASDLVWSKSSHSTNDGPSCVEVATVTFAVHVRDSKTAPGPQLAFRPAAWTAFLGFAAGS
ncbi:DUF397 domain-containing protein [Streptomyces sp. NPDC001770]